jgi:putative transcriptional regulator
VTPGPTTRRRLLVATPPLEDPNFDRTVVFVLEHDDTGAVGVVLNRPTAVDDLDIVDEWLSYCCEPHVLFRGGPVEPSALIALAAHTGTGPTAVTEIATIDLVDDAEQADTIERMRIFSGYAGWGAGQLDAELDAGVWLVVDAVIDDVFTDDPAGLWRRVLRRQPGRMALLAAAPDDLSSN